MNRDGGRAVPQCAESAMLALEEMRELQQPFTSPCLVPPGRSGLQFKCSNHSVMLTSALVEGRDFLRARCREVGAPCGGA